ncbi:MAG: TetR/AcrR family transcriptional regulator [Rhodoferax sp.]
MPTTTLPSEKPPLARTTARLNRDAWLDAAFSAAVEHGFDGVRVLSLADTLGVTRGSFYWHFKDHAALITALVERWLARESEGNQRVENTVTDDPVKDLELLLDAALAHGGEDLSNMRFELALRGLGRRDATVAAMLLKVDQERLALFAKKFARIAPDPKAARELATLFYLTIVGSFQALSRPQAAHPTKQYLTDIIGRYLVKPQTR